MSAARYISAPSIQRLTLKQTSIALQSTRLMSTLIKTSFEQLMTDARLMELCELQRIGDEVLDVISLTENQHSDIIAWMLDAKEGHGQGDGILRDLLIYASKIANDDACNLDGRTRTARFFQNWPPSRIQTTSFGAAFSARELGITANQRVDLFIVDPHNKFILLIENKAGTAHMQSQLNSYREGFENALKQSPHLKQYDVAYIALDKIFNEETASALPCGDAWLHIGYDWLESSANRALLHINRGNTAAKLVVSYCNRQTEWEPPSNSRSLQLAADLHLEHTQAIQQLINYSRGRLEHKWLGANPDEKSHWLFLLQNKSVMAFLQETQGMTAVKLGIRTAIPALPVENFEHKRVWLNLCPQGWNSVVRDDGWWPVYLTVRYATPSKTKYQLTLTWNSQSARTSEEADKLLSCLKSVDAKLQPLKMRNRRQVVSFGEFTQSELVDKIKILNAELAASLKTAAIR
ncbi:PD-(D/E)XK nuclease family protein [Chitiniphilus purpureus]|uniref:PD-(D/E)XK nuclease family protein n=1 Tax=Chitiniphilus purpureus TaxID=2981137 RepID=A0ABY6DQL2_9NEIS|nr:PD-(D/E)XK nuclease family protein [Chitiniphilus sp. CD1]UXY16650.1 PD-(D/E)XK nuclease family protein [Chitiniphilus sp. CD1]